MDPGTCRAKQAADIKPAITGLSGLALAVEAAEAATQSADRAREMVEANPTVSLINVEVREVVAHA
jgi:hypothetical protein